MASRSSPGTYGLAPSGTTSGTYGLAVAPEVIEKTSHAFEDLLKIEQKSADVRKALADALEGQLKRQTDLEEKRVKSLQAGANAMKATLDAADRTSNAFRTVGSVFADALQGNVVGALSRVNAYLQGSARTKAAGVAPSGGGAAGAAGEAAEAAGAAEAGGALVGLAAAAGPIVVAVAATKALFDVMLKLGASASPVQMERFQLALDDTQAVLGRVFVPVLELATDAVRLLGDTLASILPSADDVREALAPLRDAMDEVRSALAEVAPALKTFIGLQLQMAGAVIKVSTALSPLLWIIKGINALTGGTKTLDSSLGASARPAAFTSVDQFIKGSYAKAASQGVAGGKEEKSPLDKIIDLVGKCADYLEKIASAGGTAGKIAGAAGEGIGFAASPLGYLAYKIFGSTKRGIEGT